MVRKADFDENSFIVAATDLIAAGGPSAATMAAIAHRAGAPTGSIYHRFPSRAALLGAVWHHALSSLAEDMLPALQAGDRDGAIDALFGWTTAHPAAARVILLYRENDLIDGAVPPPLHDSLNRLNRQLGAGLTAFLKQRGHALSAVNLALANFALFDGPIAALKPQLRHGDAGTPAQDRSRAAARACARASLELLE